MDRHLVFTCNIKAIVISVSQFLASLLGFMFTSFGGLLFRVLMFTSTSGVMVLPWECEKFLWEQGQLKEWTSVQSRKQKRASSTGHRTPRRVRFAPNLVHDSPMVKHRPATGLDYTRFGEFNVPTTIPVNWVFGRINTALGKQFSASQDPVF